MYTARVYSACRTGLRYFRQGPAQTVVGRTLVKGEGWALSHAEVGRVLASAASTEAPHTWRRTRSRHRSKLSQEKGAEHDLVAVFKQNKYLGSPLSLWYRSDSICGARCMTWLQSFNLLIPFNTSMRSIFRSPFFRPSPRPACNSHTNGPRMCPLKTPKPRKSAGKLFHVIFPPDTVHPFHLRLVGSWGPIARMRFAACNNSRMAYIRVNPIV